MLVLTRDSAINVLSSITVAPTTTKLRGIPSQVLIGPEEGLAEPSAIQLDNIQTVPKSRLGRYVSTLEPGTMRQVAAAKSFALGFDTYE